ncbi:MAG: tRNA epoxyqueuosine(34) reductase QueG [Chloroflexota bacterium]
MSLSDDLKTRARELGFADARVGPSTPLEEDEARLAARLANGFLSGLDYFRPERLPLAARPRLHLPEARSVLSLAWAYDGSCPPAPAWGHGRLAGYARGRDYHAALKARLARLVDYLVERVPGASSRAFVDATPLLERALAARAGLGFVGRNNCLITPRHGSWVLLAEVLTTAELPPDSPSPGSCGACRACLDACPTGALSAAYEHRAAFCLSYLTVELRGPIPRHLRAPLGDRLLGCDTCQTVCPHNRCSAPVGEAGGLPAWLDARALLGLDPTAFQVSFAGTAAARPRRAGLLRNAAVVLGNSGDPEAVPVLVAALADPEPLVRGHAAWALGRLGGRLAARALVAAQAAEGDAWVQAELALALAEA